VGGACLSALQKGNWNVKTNTKFASLKAGVAPVVLGFALVASPAFAQQQSADEDAAKDEIVVTGTLISNPNLQRSAPVNVTTADAIELKQNNVAEEVLREIPGIVPSIGSAVNNGNGGNSFVNLRGLGSNRNVVLLDGRRVVPADLAGRFDLNNIPLALVERVDVLTGGSSTTYGADAISGVVNFVTKRDFTGFEASFSEQITEKGDGNTMRADVTTGASFDDGRGNVVLGLGYQEADPVYQGDRKIGLNTIDSFSGGNSGSGTTFPTRLVLSVLGSRQITSSPTGDVLGAYTQPYNYNPLNIFQTPFKRYNIYSQGRYEIADGIEFYSRALFSKNQVNTIIAPSGSFGIAVQVPVSNPFLTKAIRDTLCAYQDSDPLTSGRQVLTQAQCDAAAVAVSPSDPNYKELTVTLSRRAVEAGPRISQYQNTVFDYVAGFRGGITDHINYDVSGGYGQAEQVQTIKGYLLNSRIRQAVRATSKTVCLDTSNGCVPANFFTSGADLSPAAVAFMQQSSTVQTKTTLAQAKALISGDLGLTLPTAGDAISFAFGGEYRKYTAQQASDALAKSGDLAGAGGAAPDINGGYHVYEAIGEVVAPLVQDKPFIQDLTLEAGVRYSSYGVDAPSSPKYKTTTYKAGGSWTPFDGLKIRGNYAHAVRAPNISELFSPQNTGLTNLTNDPCASINDKGVRIRTAPTGVLRDVCLAQGAQAFNIDTIQQPTAAQANATSGGNLNLKPETSNSFTIGAVIQPQSLRGFSVTVDYYNIKVSGAVSSPSSGDAIDACFAAGNLSVTNPACLIIRRNPQTGGLDGEPSSTKGIFVASSNLGRLKTDGIDLTVNYRRDLGFADLSMALNGNWTHTSTFQATPSSIVRECVGQFNADCGSLQPKLQWSLRTTLGFEKVDVSLLWRHLDKFTGPSDAYKGTLSGWGTVDFTKIPSYDYFDLTSRVKITDNLTLTMTVQNLLNKKPPLVGATVGSTAFNSGNTYPSTYDTLGRRYAAALKVSF